jgi:hypothetical protein
MSIDSNLVTDKISQSPSDQHISKGEDRVLHPDNVHTNEFLIMQQSFHGYSATCHNFKIGTVAFEVEGDLDLNSVKKWFATLLWENPDPNVAIFRIKVSLFFDLSMFLSYHNEKRKTKKKEKTMTCSII